MQNDEIVEKLKKILAKADPARNPSQAEVEMAMKMAQKLAIQHNIDLGTINVNEGEDTGAIVTERVDVHSTLADTWRPHHSCIYHVLQQCFQIQMIRLGGSHAGMVGERTDVQIAAYCWAWLDPLFPRLYLTYIKSIGLIRTSEDNAVRRRSFYEGVADGIIENNRHLIKELPKQEANQYALVLARKEDIVKARYQDEFPNARRMAPRARQYNGNAAERGKAEGRKIRLGMGIGGGSSTQGRIA